MCDPTVHVYIQTALGAQDISFMKTACSNLHNKRCAEQCNFTGKLSTVPFRYVTPVSAKICDPTLQVSIQTALGAKEIYL